jgi:hypothetical protein
MAVLATDTTASMANNGAHARANSGHRKAPRRWTRSRRRLLSVRATHNLPIIRPIRSRGGFHVAFVVIIRMQCKHSRHLTAPPCALALQGGTTKRQELRLV